MSKKHKQHRHQNQGRAQPVLNPSPPVSNGINGGKKSRKIGLLLLAALVVIAGLVVYALNATNGTKRDSGAVAGSNPPLPTALASQPQPPLVLASTASTNASGARIQFATTTYDFGKVNGDEVVKYAYVFTNVGNALLEISNVQTSCGCTTAGDWSRKVEPRKTGSIPIEFNSHDFSGQVGKSITVACNDTSQPVVALQIQGNIWRAIDVTPMYAILLVTVESPIKTTTLRIVNNVAQPLTLSAPESGNPAFAAELKTNQPGREFELIVKTVPPLPAGNVSGVISLKTSSTNIPTLSITAIANMQQVVMVQPAQITLPAAPMVNPTISMVWIRNNGTNELAVTEPAVNAKGVDVQLKELQLGRYFSVTLTFPAGFEIAQGEKVELSLKSNHPEFQAIKVPVLQPPSPVPTAAPGQVIRPTLPPADAQSK
jgi:hypothetical protein